LIKNLRNDNHLNYLNYCIYLSNYNNHWNADNLNFGWNLDDHGCVRLVEFDNERKEFCSNKINYLDNMEFEKKIFLIKVIEIILLIVNR